jgi:hypothetical protein
MTDHAPTAEAPPPEDAVAAPGPGTPDDPEAMLGEQMAACHRVVLDCLGRAERAGEAEAARHGELRLAARFMALFLRQSGALDRHRDHLRRAQEAQAKAGRDSLNREVALANAQGRGFADGLEASLRRFEQAERARRAAARDRETAQPASDPAARAARSAADDLEDRLAAFATPPRRAETQAGGTAPPPKLTRQQRRAAARAHKKAAGSKGGHAALLG